MKTGELNAYLADWSERESGFAFDYGALDCCTFVDDILQQHYGSTFIPWTYADEEEANAILQERGGLDGAVTFALGSEPTEAFAELKIGDVVMWRLRRQIGLGLKYSNREMVVLLDGEVAAALVTLPVGFFIKGWHVRP